MINNRSNTCVVRTIGSDFEAFFKEFSAILGFPHGFMINHNWVVPVVGRDKGDNR